MLAYDIFSWDISSERWDMRKSRKLRKPLTLTKETLRQLVPPPAMRNAQGGFAAEAISPCTSQPRCKKCGSAG